MKNICSAKDAAIHISPDLVRQFPDSLLIAARAVQTCNGSVSLRLEKNGRGEIYHSLLLYQADGPFCAHSKSLLYIGRLSEDEAQFLQRSIDAHNQARASAMREQKKLAESVIHDMEAALNYAMRVARHAAALSGFTLQNYTLRKRRSPDCCPPDVAFMTGEGEHSRPTYDYLNELHARSTENPRQSLEGALYIARVLANQILTQLNKSLSYSGRERIRNIFQDHCCRGITKAEQRTLTKRQKFVGITERLDECLEALEQKRAA